jgi:hypothetical protein
MNAASKSCWVVVQFEFPQADYRSRLGVNAMALYFLHHNSCRVHKTLRVTPATGAGLTDHVLSLEELAALPTSRNIISTGN